MPQCGSARNTSRTLRSPRTGPATSQRLRPRRNHRPATGPSFTDVAGSWVQPKQICSAGEVGAAAFWVGLGGSQDSSPALEQIGTEGDCNRSGKAAYSAGYEFVPAALVTINLKVRPGDRMTGAVLVSGGRVAVTLKNLSTHKRFSKTFSSVTPLDTTSAEWIGEAPSLCSTSSRCTVVPLPNFGTTSFTNVTTSRTAIPARSPIQRGRRPLSRSPPIPHRGTLESRRTPMVLCLRRSSRMVVRSPSPGKRPPA